MLSTYLIQSKPVRFAKLIDSGFGKYKWGILIMLLMGIVSGLLEGIGINSLIPLFSILT